MFINDDVDGATYDLATGIPSQSSHSSKSLIIGGPGAFIPYPNHSFLSCLGPKMYILMIDWRSERRFNQLASQTTYDRCEKAIDALPPGVEHLVVLVGTFSLSLSRIGDLVELLRTQPLTVALTCRCADCVPAHGRARADAREEAQPHDGAGQDWRHAVRSQQVQRVSSVCLVPSIHSDLS